MRKVGEVRRLFWSLAPSYLARWRGSRREAVPTDITAHETVGEAVGAGQGAMRLALRLASPGAGRVALAPRLIVNEIESALIAARAGRGLTRALSYQAAGMICAGTLMRLLPEFEPPPLPVQLVLPGGRHPPPPRGCGPSSIMPSRVAATRADRVRLSFAQAGRPGQTGSRTVARKPPSGKSPSMMSPPWGAGDIAGDGEAYVRAAAVDIAGLVEPEEGAGRTSSRAGASGMPGPSSSTITIR